MKTQADAQRRGTVSGELAGRYVPRQYNELTRQRFLRDRRRRYLARVPTGAPSDAQAAMIQTLATLEWAALTAEAEGGLQALREAREHRRLFQRLIADFERSLVVKPAAAPVDPQAVMRRVIDRHRAANGAAA